MGNWKSFLFTLLFCSICLGEVGPENLTYLTENYPPANFKDEYGLLKGASVDLLYALWKKMGVKPQNITVYPWARGYSKVLTEDNHVLFSMSRTAERDTLFKWVGPIFTSRHIIIGEEMEGEKPLIFNNVSELSNYRIGVIRDDVGEETLREIGFPEVKMHLVSQLDQSINLLLSGRVKFIFMSDEALRDLIKKHGLKQKFYVAYTINYRENYFAFSKTTSDALIARFQKALDDIHEEHLKILEKAGMELYKEEK